MWFFLPLSVSVSISVSVSLSLRKEKAKYTYIYIYPWPSHRCICVLVRMHINLCVQMWTGTNDKNNCQYIWVVQFESIDLNFIRIMSYFTCLNFFWLKSTCLTEHTDQKQQSCKKSFVNLAHENQSIILWQMDLFARYK
jgi:hypothetical protein